MAGAKVIRNWGRRLNGASRLRTNVKWKFGRLGRGHENYIGDGSIRRRRLGTIGNVVWWRTLNSMGLVDWVLEFAEGRCGIDGDVGIVGLR